LLSDSLVGSRKLTGVLLQAVEEYDEVAGALVEKAIFGIRESNP